MTFSTVTCTIITALYLYRHDVSAHQLLHLFGLWPISILDSMRGMLLVCILFAGPLFENGIVDGDWKYWVKFQGVQEILSSWIGYRNFVVASASTTVLYTLLTSMQGPVSEEIVWRSLMVPLHVLAQFSEKQIVFLTPLYFGIAHVHHLYEFHITHPEIPMLMATLRSLFQFTYTSLFGFFATFLYLRTGNVFTCILAHTFCNWMGLPRFYGRVGVEAGLPIGPPDVDKKDDGTKRAAPYRGKNMTWTIAYYVILVAGSIGFYYQLFPLTESTHTLLERPATGKASSGAKTHISHQY